MKISLTSESSSTTIAFIFTRLLLGDISSVDMSYLASNYKIIVACTGPTNNSCHRDTKIIMSIDNMIKNYTSDHFRDILSQISHTLRDFRFTIQHIL